MHIICSEFFRVHSLTKIDLDLKTYLRKSVLIKLVGHSNSARTLTPYTYWSRSAWDWHAVRKLEQI